MLRLIYFASGIALAASLSASAMAQAQGAAPPAAQPQKPTGAESNEIICQKQEVLGSRLATKRVCKTRAEWADAKLQDRQAVEKVQVQRGMLGN